MTSTPLVSIITITYNAVQTLERTINSVRSQNYPSVEYILVDGASKDGTVGIIKDNIDVVSSYISEPDKGIYDAMNKGLNMANGEYVWFMNAGDELPEPDTLSRAISIAPENADVIYGETVMTDIDGNLIGERRLATPESLSWRSFQKGMVVCHQSFIARRSKADLYDTKYRFSADFDWCLRILKSSSSVCNTNIVLSRFLDGGITKQNILPGLKERFKIMTHHYGLFHTIIYHIPISIKFFSYWITKGRF